MGLTGHLFQPPGTPEGASVPLVEPRPESHELLVEATVSTPEAVLTGICAHPGLTAAFRPQQTQSGGSWGRSLLGRRCRRNRPAHPHPGGVRTGG